ncbi:CLUMA_CG005468, isoform A [Clunio marinus]|uniref:CLUMA_CG005468, isoform A n=1 Tax=Clunio marinus TaxID=568069 RepID=A0A1J1HZ72_9DIPT|nr:CLUMA_CG005468, isoform A [Clunio marinus]
MSLQHEPEQVTKSTSLGVSEETSRQQGETTIEIGNNNNNSDSARLQKAHSYSCSTNGPTTSSGLVTQQSLSSGATSKPILIRQDRTSSYLASPQFSGFGTSEETSDDDNAKAISYQLMPNTPTNRCRTCRSNERRSSISPASVIYLPRSASKESVGRLTSSSLVQPHSSSIPPVFITGSPKINSRIIRQSSQPEASTLSCCSAPTCTHAHQTSSLRQLKTDPSDQISGIAVDALRVRFH